MFWMIRAPCFFDINRQTACFACAALQWERVCFTSNPHRSCAVTCCHCTTNGNTLAVSQWHFWQVMWNHPFWNEVSHESPLILQLYWRVCSQMRILLFNVVHGHNVLDLTAGNKSLQRVTRFVAGKKIHLCGGMIEPWSFKCSSSSVLRIACRRKVWYRDMIRLTHEWPSVILSERLEGRHESCSDRITEGPRVS